MGSSEKIKDAVVRDYRRGDKTIVIQMTYKISPGEMYRILRARQVELRSDHTPGVWVKDTAWIKLDEPKRCRSISGTPKTHCPNMAYFGFLRSNGVWAYCKRHMYGRRIRNGIVEIKVHPESPAAKRGYS